MKKLLTEEDFKNCLTESENAPVFIFKHSTICSLSARAHSLVKDYIASEAKAPDFYMVKVIEERPLSLAIAEYLNVQHKSPQLILVKNREALWSESHFGIQGDAIREALRSN